MSIEIVNQEVQDVSRNDALKRAYDVMYNDRRETAEDSPAASRTALARSIGTALMAQTAEHPLIVDIGSGPQVMGRSLHMLAKSAVGQAGVRYQPLHERISASTIVSLDLAAIPAGRLPKLNRPNFHHLQADSRALPIATNTTDIVSSNLSLDMLRIEPENFKHALSEIYRILRPGGRFLANFHHATLYEELCDRYANRDIGGLPQAAYYNPALLNPFFVSEQTIVDELAGSGLEATALLTKSNGDYDCWWSIEAYRY